MNQRHGHIICYLGTLFMCFKLDEELDHKIQNFQLKDFAKLGVHANPPLQQLFTLPYNLAQQQAQYWPFFKEGYKKLKFIPKQYLDEKFYDLRAYMDDTCNSL